MSLLYLQAIVTFYFYLYYKFHNSLLLFLFLVKFKNLKKERLLCLPMCLLLPVPFIPFLRSEFPSVSCFFSLNSSNISCRKDMLAMSSLTFCLLKNAFILPPFLKTIFAGYQILDGSFYLLAL